MLSKTMQQHKPLDFAQLTQKLQALGMSVEVKTAQQGNLTCLLIEKYFMRNSSVACCSVSIYSHSPESHDIIVMSGGSAQGAFLKFSWGADSEFIDDVCRVLRSI